MDAEQAEQLRRVVAAGEAPSVSAYVAAAVRERLARDKALAALDELWGELPAEPLAWAQDRLGVAAGQGERPARAS